MAVNSFEVFRDTNGDVGLRETDSGKELYWDSDRKGWYAQDEFGEFQIAGDQNRGSSDVQAINYTVAEQDGNTTLLVQTSDELRLVNSIRDVNFTGTVTAVAVSKTHDRVAFSTGGGFTTNEILVYDKNFKNQLASTSGDSYASIAWTADKELVYVSDLGSEINVLDESLNVVQTISGLDSTGRVDYNWNKNLLAVSDGEEVLIYEKNASTGDYELIQTLSPPTTNDIRRGLEWNQSDNRLVVTSGDNNEAYIYDENFNLNTTFSVTTSVFSDVAWREDGYLAIGDEVNGVVRIFDANFNSVQNLNYPNRGFDSIDFNKGTKELLIGADQTSPGIVIFDSNFNLVKSFDTDNEVYSSVWFPNEKTFVSFENTGYDIEKYSVVRNQLNLSDSTLPDGFDLSVANDGSGIIEINEDGTTIFSDVGNAPKVIDNGATADISKIDSDRYLVEGDIYKETGDGFTQSL